jgi:hypothetical protein
MYTSSDILNQLDQCAEDFTFPMLDNGYVYPAGTQLSAYRDTEHWVLIIEIIGFNPRAGGHNGISNAVHIFGNSLNFPVGLQNENFIYFSEDDTIPTFDDEDDSLINHNCKSFLLRNEVTEVIHNETSYKTAGIDLNAEGIQVYEFLRLLDVLYHKKLVATDEEISTKIPYNLPKILTLQDWNHPDLVNGEMPSNCETFIQIAKLLETGEAKSYSPTKAPNTHWGNWPEGGTL